MKKLLYLLLILFYTTSLKAQKLDSKDTVKTLFIITQEAKIQGCLYECCQIYDFFNLNKYMSDSIQVTSFQDSILHIFQDESKFDIINIINMYVLDFSYQDFKILTVQKENVTYYDITLMNAYYIQGFIIYYSEGKISCIIFKPLEKI